MNRDVQDPPTSSFLLPAILGGAAIIGAGIGSASPPPRAMLTGSAIAQALRATYRRLWPPPTPYAPGLPGHLIRVTAPSSTLLGQEERIMAEQPAWTQAAWLQDGKPPLFWSGWVPNPAPGEAAVPGARGTYYFCPAPATGPRCVSAVILPGTAHENAVLSRYPWYGHPLRPSP